MRNAKVNVAITDEITRLALIIRDNPDSHLEINRRDGNQWTLYREKPDWSVAPEDVKGCEAFLANLRLATSDEFDFPGVSGVDEIDPVLYEAMAVVLGVTLAPEE